MKTTDGLEPPYRPVACDTYSRLELAILRRQQLHLVWHDGNVCYTRLVIPLDLETRRGEEFLLFRLPTGESSRVRLDRIERLETA